ncbi:hypothetical protein [Streptomyces chrestomyceticus]
MTMGELACDHARPLLAPATEDVIAQAADPVLDRAVDGPAAV